MPIRINILGIKAFAKALNLNQKQLPEDLAFHLVPGAISFILSYFNNGGKTGIHHAFSFAYKHEESAWDEEPCEKSSR